MRNPSCCADDGDCDHIVASMDSIVLSHHIEVTLGAKKYIYNRLNLNV